MTLYDDFVARMRRIADVQHAVAILHWDKEVYMPEGGSRFRSQQIGTLSSMAHEMFTARDMGELLHRLMDSKSLDSDQARNVELTLRDYLKEVTLPADFVERLALAQAESFSAWVRARNTNDFSLFAPKMEIVVGLKREEAALRGNAEEPYDALLDIYEPGMTTRTLDSIFSAAREKIIPMIRYIREQEQEDVSFLTRHFSQEQQWKFGIEVIKELGYDLNHGRQDISAHPFTISFSPEDVRVTTRIDEHDFSNMLWSCIHECGHALYEQGLPADHYGLPLGSAASLAIHESQSRLWENHVGRSTAFWEYQYPRLREQFAGQLKEITPDHFCRAINYIAPNLIRTEADELHYHLHVLIRYEIERELINSDLPVNELPVLWNKKYKAYLDIDVPNDQKGILQDVHWSHGSFGYFPTYSLGSFYAAQFYRQAQSDIPDLEDQLRQGVYVNLHDWLSKHVYQYGRRHDPEDLCRLITGKGLDISDFAGYIRTKYRIPVQQANPGPQMTNSSV